MIKNLIVTAIVALVVSLGIGFLVPSQAPVAPDESNFAGLSDRDVKAVSLSVTGQTKVNEFAQGGGTLTISQTGATRTLTESELINNNVIEIASTEGAVLALTLPATSTMKNLLPSAGDMREWFIDNQHLAATTTTITAGTGIDLIAYTTNDDVIDGQEVARLTCWRKSVNRDVYCLVSENLKAD